MRQIISSPARRTWVLLAGLVSMGGCATKQDVRDLRTEILDELRRVSASQDSLRAEVLRQTVQTQDTLRNASRELVDIRGDVLTTLNRLGNQLDQIEELVGQNSLAISSLRDQMEGVRRGGATSGGAAAPGTTPVTAAPTSRSGDAAAMYEAAMRQLNRGSLSAARAALQQFLSTYPSDEQAPQAHFYLADILEREERRQEAIEAFAEIPELYPTSERVPDALYRMGALHLQMGNEGEGRAILERLVNTYPEHSAADLARDLLGGDRAPRT